MLSSLMFSRAGGSTLVDKVKKFRPKIIVFNGKGIYEVFSGRKDFLFGKQPEPVQGTNTVSGSSSDVDILMVVRMSEMNVVFVGHF